MIRLPDRRAVPQYPRHDAFFAPAAARAEWWRVVGGCLAIVVIHQMLLSTVVMVLRQRYGTTFADTLVAALSFGSTPGSVILLLFSFGLLGLAAVIAVRALHERRAATLFGPDLRLAASLFLATVPFLIGLDLLLLPLALANPGISANLATGPFLAWLPLAIVALLVQVVAEEMIFRGYLQQQLAAISTSRLVWMLIPSALFAVGHYDTARFGQNAWLVFLWAGLFGVFAADLTARTGNLGAAIAFHLAINVSAFLLTANAGDLDGMALWTLDVDLANPAVLRPLLLADVLSMLNAWLLTRLVLRV